MKLAVSMWCYFKPWRDGNLDVPGFISEAARIGADGVELLDFFYNEPGAPRRTEFIDAELEPKRELIHTALEQAKMPVAIFSVANDFAKPTEVERRASLAEIEFGVREAARFGAGVVRVFAGNLKEGLDPFEVEEWVVEGLTAASVYAHEMGVELALENHGRWAGSSGFVTRVVERVRAETGLTTLGANPDTGNFLLAGEASLDAVSKLAPFAKMAHLKDFRLGPGPFEGADGKHYEGCALGEGQAGVAGCLSLLSEDNPDLWLSLEYEGEETPFTAVPRSLTFARSR